MKGFALIGDGTVYDLLRAEALFDFGVGRIDRRGFRRNGYFSAGGRGLQREIHGQRLIKRDLNVFAFGRREASGFGRYVISAQRQKGQVIKTLSVRLGRTRRAGFKVSGSELDTGNHGVGRISHRAVERTGDGLRIADRSHA